MKKNDASTNKLNIYTLLGILLEESLCLVFELIRLK